MTKFIPISVVILCTIIATSCTGSLDLQENLNENFKISEQGSFKMQAKESDSTKTSTTENNVGLYPEPDEPDVPIKDTHDWRQKP